VPLPFIDLIPNSQSISIIFFLLLVVVVVSMYIQIKRYNAPPRVIQLLLEHDTTKKSLFVDSLYGQVPLHVACRCNLHPESLKLLLDHDVDKKTVLLQDNANRLPLHVAYLYCPKPNAPQTSSSTTTRTSTDYQLGGIDHHHHHPSSIQYILQAMIHGRIERVGLINWKHDMHTFLDRLSGVDERDFDAQDKLEMTCQALQLLLERAILLELAIWKLFTCYCDCGCGGPCDRQSPQQQHTESCQSQRSMKDFSDEYKRERRIKSGAETIIPGVLSFLEDEPIVDLLKQMGEG
jgi:hypothetical protein